MKDHMDFETTPSEEDCAQLGSENYEQRARFESRTFIEQIKRELGEPPAGVRLTVASNPHDFGSYLSVRAYFDPDIEEQAEYVYKIESDISAQWDEESKAAFQRLEGQADIRAEEIRHAHGLNDGDIAEAMFDSVVEAADGCPVEPDGTCQHGYRSPLLVLGII